VGRRKGADAVGVEGGAAAARGDLPREDTSLTRRVFRAGLWSFLFHGLMRGIGFIRNVVLARILSPDDLGLFGITLAILSVLDRFSQTGLKAALIQRKGEVDEYLDSAWTVQLIRGALLAAILFIGSPYISAFFEEPRATGLIRMLAASMLLKGVQNIGLVKFTRDLELRFQYLHRFSSRIVDLVVSIVLAFILKDAWALMIGLVAGRVTAVIVSYAVHPYRPKIRFNLRQTNELGRYGRWVFLNNVLFFLVYRGDNFVIAKFLDTTALGFYTLAYSISEVVSAEVSRVLNEPLFSAYARVQMDLGRVRKGFFAATELVAAAAFPAAAVLYLMSGALIDILLGPAWAEVASVLPALALAGAVRGLTRNCSAVCGGLGQPHIVFSYNIAAVVFTYSAMFVLLPRFGLLGVAYSVLIGQIAMLPAAQFAANRLLKARIGDLFRSLIPGTLLTVAVGGTLIILDRSGLTGSIVATITRLLAAAATYAIATLLLWRVAKSGPMRLLEFSKERKTATRERMGEDVEEMLALY